MKTIFSYKIADSLNDVRDKNELFWAIRQTEKPLKQRATQEHSLTQRNSEKENDQAQ